MKKMLALILSLSLVVGIFVMPVAAADEETPIKNVIILIPDGMSLDAVSLARWYNGGELLAMDENVCGLVRTYNSDSPIADSAPAGTAMATGHKSHTGYVGVLPDVASMLGEVPMEDSMKRAPVANILEAAQLSGKATGLISTSEVMHATPADFSAHYPSRKNYDIISEQMVYNQVDVVFGGGSLYMQPEGRKDGKNLLNALETEGYDVLLTKDEFTKYKGNKVWGLFAPAALPYDMDNDGSTPTIVEMTEKAINILQDDEDGFFLMVEGSKIDWAAHANDPVGLISDILAFDEAVEVALDYAKEHKDTVVIVVSDHGTGGVSIGNSSTSSGYDKTALSKFIDPLKKATRTGEGLESLLNVDRSNVIEVMSTYYGITDLTEDEIQAIKDADKGSLNYVVGPMISDRSYIGWTTNGHTGQEVVLSIYSPTNDRLYGVVDNTDIAYYMADQLGLSLQETTEKLYIPLREAFEAKGAQVSFVLAENDYVLVKKGTDELKLYVQMNKAEFNGTTVELSGLVIFNGFKTFAPQDAIALIN